MVKNRALISLGVATAISIALSVTAGSPAEANTFVRFQNFGNLLCLQPAGGSTEAGAAIVQVPCSTDPAQTWEAISLSSNHAVYHFMNEVSRLCMDARGTASNGTPVQQWTCNSITNENWTAAPGTSSANQVNSNVSGASNLCLDVPGASMEVGLGVQIWKCNGTVAQAWYTR